MICQAQVSFTVSSLPPVGNQPRAVIATDVNGDGNPDLLTPNGGADTISVMTNNGSGGFMLSSSPGTGANPSAIAIGDFNKDGKMDAVTVNYYGNTLTVLTNNGSGGFATMATPTVGSHPQAIAVADLNADGWPDLVDADSSDSALTVYTNNGAGGFGLSGIYPVGSGPDTVTAADLNGDHKPELICANAIDNTLSVLINDGSGGFGGTPVTYPAGGNPYCVIAVDVNGDTNKDLVCANFNDNSVTVLINDGSGGFGSAATYPVGSNPDGIAAADVDGDGRTDLAVADRGNNSVLVLLNDGNGVFTNGPTVGAGGAPYAITSADVDGDGKIDLVTANESASKVAILINTTPLPATAPPIITQQPVGQTNAVGGSVAFTVVASVTNGPHAFNYQWRLTGTNLPAATNSVLILTNLSSTQAGIYDVVVSNNIGSVTSSPAILAVLPYLQQVGFRLASSPTVGSQPQGVTAADVNGDGRIDLIAANAAGTTLSVLTNSGSGGFGLAASPATGSGPETVAVADVNGDGRIDLCSANYGSGSLSVLTNNGGGGFGLAATLGVGANPIGVITADVNGDGKPDYISANSGNTANSISVLTNNGRGSFTTAGSYIVGGSPWSVAAADVNGDGKVDLIAVNTAGNTIKVLTNTANGVFAFASTNIVGNGPHWVSTGDLNGDGKPDVITANYTDNTLSVLTNDGSGGIVLAGTYAVGASPIFVAAADVNGDGLPDVASVNYGNASVTILTNNGSGGLVFALTSNVGANPGGLAFADVNGDGKVDMISANRGANTLTVLTNYTPFPPPSLPFITAQPYGQTNLAGALATFSVSAAAPTGPQLFSYQWRMGGTNLPAATNNILNLPNLALNQAGIYDVVITNSAGSVTSAPAVLSVSAILVNINGQVASGTANAVTSATISFTSGFQNGFVFYTLDGTTPSINSTLYSGSFTISNNVVVQAMALSSDFSQTGFSPAVTVQIVGPLNVTTPGGGSVTANGYPISAATNYATGAPIILTATPSNGWSFIGWQGGASGNSNPLNLNFSQPNSIQAIFGTTVTTNTLGNGTVVFSQPNPVPFGTALKASALPVSGSYLLAWSGAASGTNTPTTVTVTNPNPVVGALFVSVPVGSFSLSVVVLGSGSVSNNPQQSYYSSNSSVVLKATNSPGVAFLGWSRDVAAATNTITVVMTNNKVIVATFGVVPTVSVSPTNQTISAGSNLTITASTSGLPPLGIQWQKNLVPVNGATNATYVVSNSAPTDAGSYVVVVTNSSGSVTSAIASVTVIGLPIITNQPAALTIVTNGHAAVFAVGAYGWPNPAYQWRLNGAKVNGAINAALTVTNAFAVNAGTYTVVITNVYGSVTSTPAVLTVTPLGIVTPAKLVNGQYQVSFDTATGVAYTVQYSTDLKSWFQLFTLSGSGTPVTFTEPAGNPQRFYRISMAVP